MTDPSLERRIGWRAMALASAVFALGIVGAAGLARAGIAGATGEVFRSDGGREPHPRRWTGLLVVPRDVGQNAHLRVSYWRAAERRPNRGAVSVDFEIRRDTDGDGTTDAVERLTVSGQVEELAFEALVGPLAPLRAGDLVLIDAHLRAMPRARAYQRADLEVALLDSASPCPDPGPTAGDLEPPRKIIFPSPQYTEQARRARLSGLVILETIIACDGRVRRIEVLKGLPLGLADESVEAVAQWRFAPARANGVPIEVFFNFTINFQVQTGRTPTDDDLETTVTVEGRLGRPAE